MVLQGGYVLDYLLAKSSKFLGSILLFLQAGFCTDYTNKI